MTRMALGENIRRLRRKLGITQEVMAECLDVSIQTVSKWEREEVYPAVTMLPSLANLFGVTVDALLGMPATRDAGYLPGIYTRAHQAIAEGRAHDAAAMLREALREFPGEMGLASELALALALTPTDMTDSAEAVREAITLSERVLRGNASEKICATTRANLCLLYLRAGERDRADALARRLPHVWESREAILPFLSEGPEQTAQRAHSLSLLMATLSLTAQSPEKEALLQAIILGLQGVPFQADWAALATAIQPSLD